MKKFLLSLLIIVAAVVVIWWWFSLLDRMPPINERSKTCVVTGASSGIGREIAREMINRGWRVLGVARRGDTLRALATELGPSFVPYVCDVSKEEQVHQVSEQMKNAHDEPTLFFLNAGAGWLEQPFAFSVQRQHDTFDVNYFGVISWVNEWLNTVKTYGGGTFVATSSVASLFATPGAAAYSASKAALSSCFQALRLQYRTDGISFVLVLPGPVQTELLKAGTTLPFTHDPVDEARVIVRDVFARKKIIEPSWLYALTMRFANWLPDSFVLRVLTHKKLVLNKP